MKFVQAYKITVIQSFIIDQTDKKIKNWEKNWTFLYIQRTLGLAYFPHFGGKTFFSKNLALSYTAPHGPLTPSWVPEKNLRANSMKTSEQKDRQTLFIWPLSHGQESYKRISQLSGIAVDNKNKIQYNSAQHTSLT